MTHPALTYTTDDEIRYVANVGKHFESERGEEILTRREWLQRYIAAAELRSHWGAIDGRRVIAHARRKLTLLSMVSTKGTGNSGHTN